MSVGLSDDDSLFSCSVWRWGWAGFSFSGVIACLRTNVWAVSGGAPSRRWPAVIMADGCRGRVCWGSASLRGPNVLMGDFVREWLDANGFINVFFILWQASGEVVPVFHSVQGWAQRNQNWICQCIRKYEISILSSVEVFSFGSSGFLEANVHFWDAQMQFSCTSDGRISLFTSSQFQ